MEKVAIVGYGYVGKGMHKVFPDAVLYDPPQGLGSKEEVNQCDLAIVCVPTNMKEDGSADLSIVEEVINWLETPLILFKSTVPPGTVGALREKYAKRIAFSPEYMGEGKYFTPPWKYPDPSDTTSHGFMVIGGTPDVCQPIIDIFAKKMGPHTRFRMMTSLEAEIVKYAENTWGACKVIFAHQLRDVCEKVGANWNQVREGWIDDPRVEPMHTQAFGNHRGFGGKCYPKDLAAFLKFCDKIGYDHKLLKAVWEQNKSYHDGGAKDY